MTENSKTMFCIGRVRFTRQSAVAFLTLTVLAVCFFLSAPYGLTETDEPMYQAYEYRLLHGDRLFFDDWTLTPFSTIFNYIPFAVYYSLTGGTAGLLLALRYFFVFCKLATFAAVFFVLRKKGYWAILAASVVASAAPFGIKTLNYYFVCSCALLFAGLVLFVKKEPKPVVFVLAGFVFSMAVLAEPSMAAIWFLFTLITVSRRLFARKLRSPMRTESSVFTGGSWLYSFIGIAAAAAFLLLLCAVFFMRAPFEGLRQGFLNALNDPERSGIGIGALIGKRLNVIGIYIRIFHPALFYPFIALLPAAALARRFCRRAAPFLLAALVLLYAALTVRLLTFPMREIGYAIGETVCHPLPLCLLAPVLYVFTEHKNRRLLAFLLFGFCAMLCGDMISMTAFGAFSEVCAVPALLILRDYCLEHGKGQSADAPAPKKKTAKNHAARRSFGGKTVPVLLAMLLVFVSFAEAAHLVYQSTLFETERIFVSSDAPLDTVISCGVYRGVRTTAGIAETYEKSARDAETAGRMCENRMYVADLAPTVYLDADALIAAHSPYYYYQEGWDRVSLWWAMHPEKRPDVVYIPHVSLNFMSYPDQTPEEKLAWLRERAQISVTPGEIGDIVKIECWK